MLFLFIAVARAVARRSVRVVARPERCLVIGDSDSAEPVRRKLRSNLDLNARLIGRVPLEPEAPMPDVLGSLDNLGIILAEHDIDRVLIAPGASDPELILHTIRMIKSMGVKVSVLPRLFEVVGSAVEFDDLDGIPLLGLRRQGLPLSSRVLKRTTDLVGLVADPAAPGAVPAPDRPPDQARLPRSRAVPPAPHRPPRPRLPDPQVPHDGGRRRRDEAQADGAQRGRRGLSSRSRTTRA